MVVFWWLKLDLVLILIVFWCIGYDIDYVFSWIGFGRVRGIVVIKVVFDGFCFCIDIFKVYCFVIRG